MNTPMLASLIIKGFGIAFLHAAIPTHWLPFVAAAKSRKWSTTKTLGITALAGGGHVLMTSLLGVLIVWLGLTLDERLEKTFPYVAGGILILIGTAYIWQYYKKRRHHHLIKLGGLHHCSHPHDHEGHATERLTFWGLLGMLTFSPCEGFLPVYLSGSSYGIPGFVLLSSILAVATVGSMILFTWLTLIGAQKFRLSFLDRYEGSLVGIFMWLLSISVIAAGH